MSIAAICVCLALGVAFLSKPAATTAPAEESVAQDADEKTEGAGLSLVEDAEDPLSLWNDDAPLKKELVAYVEAVTDESSPDFIPAEDRIATFDVDGTLINETDPQLL